MGLVGLALLVVAVLLVAYLGVRAARLRLALRAAEGRLRTYGAKVADLSYGRMTYVDVGQGETILSMHGLYGGYDQAYDNVRDFASRHRIVAPSRFGYLGSSIKGNGTPREQAEAYVELLDSLCIDRVYALGTSAGGTPAIRFALDHPERTKGLILCCSAAPWDTKPITVPDLMGPSPIMNHDFPMWLAAPLFGIILGMAPDTIHTMLPLSRRREGANLDAKVTNRDMAVRFEQYPIESLKVPVLLLHARDDDMAKFSVPEGYCVERSLHRYPQLTALVFETGGHLMVGHSQEINEAVGSFIEESGRGLAALSPARR